MQTDNKIVNAQYNTAQYEKKDMLTEKCRIVKK